jgi:peptidoglycan/LPS O-acetylase OafA/YrhL
MFTIRVMGEPTAIAAALLGLAVLVPYWIAADQAGETTPGFNVLIHALGSAGVLVLLLVPGLERWVNSHVMSG